MAGPTGRRYYQRRNSVAIGGIPMWHILESWPAGFVIGLVAVIGFFLWMITWVIAPFWSRVRLAEMEAALKREFLQRGLSVDEIERLIRASQQTAASGGPVNERELDVDLASILVQYEVSAETMEQVVRTFQATDPATKKAV